MGLTGEAGIVAEDTGSSAGICQERSRKKPHAHKKYADQSGTGMWLSIPERGI